MRNIDELAFGKQLDEDEADRRRTDFLSYLASTCDVTAAMARAMGEPEGVKRSVGWFYLEKDRNEKFSEAWDQTLYNCFLADRLPRGSHWIPKDESTHRKVRFLESYRSGGSVANAVLDAGGDQSWYFKEAQKDHGFASAWKRAQAEVEARVAIDPERVRYFLGLREMTQNELARRSFTSGSHIVNVLQEKSGVSEATLEQMANALAVKPWMLLKNGKPPTPQKSVGPWRTGYNTGIGREGSIDPRTFWVTGHAIDKYERRTGVRLDDPSPITESILDPKSPELDRERITRLGFTPDPKHDGQTYIPDGKHVGAWAVEDKGKYPSFNRIVRTYLEQRRFTGPEINPEKEQNKTAVALIVVGAIAGILALLAVARKR